MCEEGKDASRRQQGDYRPTSASTSRTSRLPPRQGAKINSRRNQQCEPGLNTRISWRGDGIAVRGARPSTFPLGNNRPQFSHHCICMHDAPFIPRLSFIHDGYGSLIGSRRTIRAAIVPEGVQARMAGSRKRPSQVRTHLGHPDVSMDAQDLFEGRCSSQNILIVGIHGILQ